MEEVEAARAQRLPPGSHGIPADVVARNQTVEELAQRLGVSWVWAAGVLAVVGKLAATLSLHS